MNQVVFSDRFRAMEALYRTGWTLERIGNAWGLTRERVRQILAEAGMDRMDGGVTVSAIASGRKRAASRHVLSERASMRAYGCSKERARELNVGKPIGDHYGRAFIFRQQKKTSTHNRGIAWELTFEQWCRVWDESGKWFERGRRKDQYCMSRIADTGPYSFENVRIITCSENAKESFLVVDAKTRAAKRIRHWITPAQQKVVDMASRGMANKEIARVLKVLPQTVAQHKVNVRKKLKVLETQK